MKRLIAILLLFAVMLGGLMIADRLPGDAGRAWSVMQVQARKKKSRPAPVTRLDAPRSASLHDVVAPRSVARIDYSAMTVYFSAAHRMPLCVAYELTPAHVSMSDAPTAEKRKRYNFAPDPAVRGCPEPGDYRGSGWTRGHMAPAMDMRWSKLSMTDCFLMTNMCPQAQALNNGPWRMLEERVHRAVKRIGAVWVYTGPIIGQSPERIGPKRDITVPAAFYKVLYSPSMRCAIAFVYDNENSPRRSVKQHAITVAEVERRTGLVFFTSLPATTARTLKAQCDPETWF